MVWEVPLSVRATKMHIVAMIPTDNYIVAQATNKVLLSWRLRVAGFDFATAFVGLRLNAPIGPGFVLEGLGEPYPDDEAVRRVLKLRGAQEFAYSLHVRARKPSPPRPGRG